MTPNQRFLVALAAGVLLFVLPSTLEMERRSHGLSAASRAAHILDGLHFPTHEDGQAAPGAAQAQVPPAAPAPAALPPKVWARGCRSPA